MRKPKLPDKQIREIKALLSDPAALVKDIAERYGVSRAPLYKRVGVTLPVNNYPELAALEEIDLQSLSLGFGGSALCLKTRDLHVSIAGLVTASQPLMDMATSLVAARNGKKISSTKSAAARENGRNGGVRNWR